MRHRRAALVGAVTKKRASRIFLLSPASTSGVRAAQLASPEARFDCARDLRSPEGVPVADAFAFLSSLYFRGKIAYARRFAADEEEIRVIAPGFGLVAPSWRLTVERLELMKGTRVDLAEPAYLGPMAAHAAALREELGDGAQVVLLGSIATGKYVDALEPALGDRLVFPRAFVGAGDMQRGALMLRAARSGEELDYAPLHEPRHGKRPAKAAAAPPLTPSP
jgi:hypothetical protein